LSSDREKKGHAFAITLGRFRGMRGFDGRKENLNLVGATSPTGASPFLRGGNKKQQSRVKREIPPRGMIRRKETLRSLIAKSHLRSGETLKR